MSVTRRHFALSVAAFSLSACGSAAQQTRPQTRSALADNLRPVPTADYDA